MRPRDHDPAPMRGPDRRRIVLAGKVQGKALLVAALALTAIMAVASNRIGWTSYWGGLFYAPFALIVAVLLAAAITKKRDVGESKSRRSRG